MKRIISAILLTLPPALALGQDGDRLSGDEIRDRFADATVVKYVPWESPMFFDANGEVRGGWHAFRTPTTRDFPDFLVFAWRVEGDQLCVDHDVFSGGCFYVTPAADGDADAFVLIGTAPYTIAGAPRDYEIRIVDGNPHDL